MNRADARGYDLFKTIVAVILALILLLMLLRRCSTNAAAPAPTQIPPVQNPTRMLPASPVVTEMVPSEVIAQTSTSSPEPTAVELTTTPTTAAPTNTPIAPAVASTETATAIPEQAASAPAQSSSCNTASPSRLAVGQTARVLQRLNVRSDASIKAAIIKVDPLIHKWKSLAVLYVSQQVITPIFGGRSNFLTARRAGRQKCLLIMPITSSRLFSKQITRSSIIYSKEYIFTIYQIDEGKNAERIQRLCNAR